MVDQTRSDAASGRLLINVQRAPGDPGRWREATDDDREQRSTTFHCFIDSCLARSTEVRHPKDEDTQ
jgi:hypothetical protein